MQGKEKIEMRQSGYPNALNTTSKMLNEAKSRQSLIKAQIAEKRDCGKSQVTNRPDLRPIDNECNNTMSVSQYSTGLENNYTVKHEDFDCFRCQRLGT